MTQLTRRAFTAAACAAIATPRASRAQNTRRNASAFSGQDWREHFGGLGRGAVLADTASRALHFWSGDGATYRIFPTSVPRSDELTRRGYTEIVRKRVGPDWTPTPSQIERFPDWTYMPPGPDNPLGTHAMYPAWRPISSMEPRHA